MEGTDDPSFYTIQGQDTEFPDKLDELELELVSPNSGTFYITKVAPGAWNVGVQGTASLMDMLYYEQNYCRTKNFKAFDFRVRL